MPDSCQSVTKHAEWGAGAVAACPVQWDGMLREVTALKPALLWQSLSPELYITFWSLSIQDIYCPTDS